MAISDALAELKAFIIDHAQPEKIEQGCQYVDELEAAIDNRVSELLAANNAEVERRRKLSSALVAMQERDDRNSSLPSWYRETLDAALDGDRP